MGSLQAFGTTLVLLTIPIAITAVVVLEQSLDPDVWAVANTTALVVARSLLGLLCLKTLREEREIFVDLGEGKFPSDALRSI